jgi:Leucine-rich repeat (LRR) protein
VAKLEKLALLDLTRNQVRDLTPVKDMQAWRYLYLDGNQVTDLKPLVDAIRPDIGKPHDLVPYRAVSLRGNPLGPDKSTVVPELRKAVGSVTVD